MSRYSIWVMEYAAVPNYHLSGLIYGAHNQGFRKLPYCYVVIKGEGRNGKTEVAMVDVGYNHKAYGEVLANTYGVRNWHPPREVLAEAGLKPEDVSSIFITHAHFDHMGNIEDFPNATFYLQERELSKWVWAMSLERRFRWLMLGIDPGDILRAVDLARQGRLVCVDGDREDILPGIDVHAAFDTHTWGSMWVTVRNGGAGQRVGVLRRPGLHHGESARRRSERSALHSRRARHRQPGESDHGQRSDGQSGRRRLYPRYSAARRALEGYVSFANYQRPSAHHRIGVGRGASQPGALSSRSLSQV